MPVQMLMESADRNKTKLMMIVLSSPEFSIILNFALIRDQSLILQNRSLDFSKPMLPVFGHFLLRTNAIFARGILIVWFLMKEGLWHKIKD